MDWFLYDNGLRHERFKDDFLFSSGKFFSKFKLKSIIISERRTVLLPQFSPFSVWTYLYSFMLIPWYQKITFIIAPFVVVKKRTRNDTGSCKYLPALLKTIGYRFCDNIFKFTNKEDWSQMWKGIQDKQLKKSTIKTKLYK